MNEKVSAEFEMKVSPPVLGRPDAVFQHAEAMSALMMKASPPITSSPLTCFLHPEDLAQRGISLDGSKIKRVLDWGPKETFRKETVEEVVEVRREACV
jgi:nucleoside-diphosphate-sugar epimerase